MEITLKSLVYPLEAGRVLLMHRGRDPFLGLWVAPGGKLDHGESPYEAGLRELEEETGLRAEKLVLRGIVTTVVQETSETTLYFLYACNEFSGELIPESEEGRVSWQHLHHVFTLPMPEMEQRFLTYAVNLNLPLYQARMMVENEGQIVILKEF